MATFQNNTTYTGRFITDADSFFAVDVVKRTAKTVTYEHPHTRKLARAKIYNNGEGEYFYPMGRYSMAPVIRAERVAA